MSTAIVSVYTPEGFIIGADGMRRDGAGMLLDLGARKIFFIEGKDLLLAYAWAGATHIFDSQNQLVFNFLVASDEIGKGLNAVKSSSFDGYARAFSAGVAKKLIEAKKSGKITEYPSVRKEGFENLIASVLLIGYFRARACRVRVEFRNVGQTLLSPELRELHDGHAPVDFHLFSGSADTYKEVKPTHFKGPSMQDAEDFVRAYIQACIDNQDRFDDCKDIGGHIHIAAVTPKRWEWITPPKKETLSSDSP